MAALFLGACAYGAAPQGQADGGADAALGEADAGAADATAPDATVANAKPIVILMIGDGMGPGQLAAASHYAHGQTGQLFMESLPVRGQLRSASLSGITDSAAAATAMATGAATFNGRVGVNRAGDAAENLVEVARRRGLAAGVVTTSSLPHATPGSFTAHRASRHDYVGIADHQATSGVEVLLGGGMQYFAPAGPDSERDDAGLIAPMTAAGYAVATNRAELDAIAPGTPAIGLFAANHMTYTVDRDATSDEPTLTEMTLAALRLLDHDDDGFVLVVEGARIDMASHGNDARRTITETIAFDDAVRAVHTWAAERDNVTLIVTADHETGGLEVVTGYGPGSVPDVAWRWGNHTNARVDVFGRGPGADVFNGQLRDHRWIHAALRARVDGAPFTPPPVVITPDGHTGDLRHLAASQTVSSGFGVGFNQLDALRVDADAGGLAVGVEGAFEWDANAVVILIDVDGGGAGHGDLVGALGDRAGRVDGIVSSLGVRAPAGVAFAADFALTVFGGADPHLEDLDDDAGLRGLVPPLGSPNDFGWYGAAINFDDGVRARAAAASPVSGSGLEAYVPWTALYPNGNGQVPPGATISIAVVLVNDDGGYTSNQTLPPLPAGSANPGRAAIALPAVVRFTVDSNGDGVADGDTAPTIE